MPDKVHTTTIVAFGDSVTQATPHVTPEESFVVRLEVALNRRLAPTGQQVTVVNSGVGGENTAEGLARIQRDVLDHDPTLVLIEFGLNDIRYEPEKTVPLGYFQANLLSIISRTRNANAHCVLMTPNPIIDSHHPYSQATDYYDEWGGCDQLLADYADAVRQVATAEDVPLCDVRRAFLDRAIHAEFRGHTDDYSDLTALTDCISPDDGVHPIALGHELMAFELYKLLIRHPELLSRSRA